MSQTIQPTQLSACLRALRVGMDDEIHVRRTVHLAAAKIEDLQQQVNSLSAALEKASQPAQWSGQSRRAGGRRRAH